jgi:mRNA interferase HicA
MKGIEFIRKIKKLARQRECRCIVDKKRGKGSHVTLYYGNKRTIVRNPKDELKKGTISAMLRQLELTNRDIQDI